MSDRVQRARQIADRLAAVGRRFAVPALALSVAACSGTGPWPRSDHYDGSVFSNPGVPKESSVAGYLRLRLTTSQPAWPEQVAPLPAAMPAARVTGDEIRVTMIGHATMLIQFDGINVLTDPVWSARASPFSFAGPKRITPPALPIEALPPIDVVLISHNHFDHLDLPTLRTLDARAPQRVMVPLGNRALVTEVMPRAQVSEHDWGESVPLADGLRIHVLPMQHGSGRSPFDQQATLWAAYLLESSRARVYFVGDAGYGDGRNYRDAGVRFAPIDLTLLPMGAYEPTSFMADSHIRPSDAVTAFTDTRARFALGHHFDTFQLGFEAYGAAAQELSATLATRGIASERFRALRAGEVVSIPLTPPAPGAR